MTVLAKRPPLPDPPEFPEPDVEPWPVSEPVTDGGGGITFVAPRDAP